MPTVNHKMISFFNIRDRLSQAAELAADSSGKVDLQKVPAELRSTLAAVAGDAPTLKAVNAKLDQGLNDVDKFDTGKHGGRMVPATGGCGSQTRTEDRIDGFRRAQGTLDPPQSGLATLIQNLTGRRKTASNLVLDEGERQRLQTTGSPAAQAMLSLLDAQAGTKSPYAKYFADPDKVQVTTKYVDDVQRARFHAAAGATQDLASVMVKDLETGKWTTGPVNADGSFDLDVGKAGHGYAVWFQTKGGEKFSAGECDEYWYSSTLKLSQVVDSDSPLRAR